MRMLGSLVARSGFLIALVVIVTACTAPAPAPGGNSPAGGQAPAPAASRGPKTITIGVTAPVQAMGVFGNQTTAGGWYSTAEVHSDGLITSEAQTRNPMGRLAEKVPTLDDGSITLLPDGKMRVTYKLRTGITWQDGVPFTARDIAFTYRFNSDKGLPMPAISGQQRTVLERIESVEAPDDTTAVFTFKGPFYRAGNLGVRAFWLEPEHILGAPYAKYLESKNPDDVANLPYWTSEYIHLGPFRLTSFDPNTGMAFQAYDRYFLGKPKVDTVRIQTFTDFTTLFSNLLAGSVDLFPDIALSVELGYQLKDRWESSGDGKVYAKQGNTWFMAHQVRPSMQMEPAALDVNVRAAIYHALDRDTLAEGLLSGHRELAAYSLLPPSDVLYDATKDALRKYAYDPSRAKALLEEAGWTQGSDGIFHNNRDGRPFHTALWVVPPNDRDVSAASDMMRRIGLQVDELVVPAAQVRNSEYRASYPGFELSAQGNNDAILGRLLGPAASAQTGWAGNRGGYEDPRAQELVSRYQAALTLQDQFQGIKAVSDFLVAELPIMPLYYVPEHMGVRKGVQAFDDIAGGEEAAQYFGTFTRNAYMWDVQ
jgi:peptide/nickel transport system substrate-binding protein